MAAHGDSRFERRSEQGEIDWPKHAIEAVRAVNDAIPPQWIVPPELLAKYPSGSDIRPLAHTCGLLNEHEVELTSREYDMTALVAKLRDGSISSSSLVTAFAKRAAIAHQAVCCLAGFYYEDALVRAKELDEDLSRTGRPIGPLHGLPISVKSNYKVKGQVSSAGFSNVEIADSHSHYIEILIAAGAIVYCRTTLPQAIMALECQSFWGQTLNPLNTSLSAGGSSGGCSALMAFDGSPISFGSDIGGSLRQPAACVGLWTLKPTVGRMPRDNTFKINAGFDSISSTSGPQCRSLRDLQLIYKTVLDSQPWLREHGTLPIPWQLNTAPHWRGAQGKMRVGYMEHDGIIKPHPPIARGLRKLVEALRADARFEVVPFEPYRHAEGIDVINALYYPDGGNRIRETAKIAGEPVLPLMQWLLDRPSVKRRSIEDLWEVNARRDAFRNEYLAHWQRMQVDIVICPAQVQTAPQLGSCRHWGYTSVYNLLEWPAAVFPTGLSVDPEEDSAKSNFTAASEAETEAHSIYAASRYANTPICLQAFSCRFEDEKLLKALEVIQGAVLPLK